MLRPDRKLFSWQEVEDVLPQPGIYAWYYKHVLTDFDINTLVAELSHLPKCSGESLDLVRRFLETHLFEPFHEEPYSVELRGPLKPTYEGELINKLSVSTGLVERTAAEPERLRTLKRLLERVVPEFASPIYIGMSDNLNTRLRKHKRLIEAYKAASGKPIEVVPELPNDQADHSFACRVAQRGFMVGRLVVSVRQDDTDGGVRLDAENILNRLNYPLCGRN